jgi:myo-inositol-1(or 4)-monophosphatase
MSRYSEFLSRIKVALEVARRAMDRFTPGLVPSTHKLGHGPTTEADALLDGVLRNALQRETEGWLSEESDDELDRTTRRAVWVVDALDGTREFVQGIPEFCISVAMVEDGIPVAGGICNPATRETFLGSLDTGVTYNGRPVRPSSRGSLDGAVVLASRSEVHRGEWELFRAAPFVIRPMGSVAYKLALVAAGLADATFTRTPKHVWDVAAGVALAHSAGGVVRTLSPSDEQAPKSSLLVSGLLASAPSIAAELSVLVESHHSGATSRPTP